MRARICTGALVVVAMAVAGTLAFGVVLASGPPAPPPVPTITSAPSSATSFTSATFKFKDAGAASDPDNNHDKDAVMFSCSTDGSPYASCTSPATYTGLHEGAHTFRVTAQQEGTSPSAPAAFTWSVSTHPPSIVLTFPANAGDYNTVGWNSGCPTSGYCGSASDPAGVSQVQLSIQQVSTGKYWDGSSFSRTALTLATASLSSPSAAATYWSYAFVATQFPTDSKYTVAVRAADTIGHRTLPSNSLKVTFTIDRKAPPTPTITSRPTNPSTSSSAGFSYTDRESNATFQCSLDTSTYQLCPTGASYSGLATGPHQFRVIACDAAGNCSGAATYGWTIGIATSSFGIAGSATGRFYPGAPGLSINLVIANPFSSTLTVTAATVSVTGTSAAGCDASNFSVIQGLVGTVDIPANTTESLSAAGVPASNWPAVQMIDTNSNQDACQRVTVNFKYAGSGNHS